MASPPPELQTRVEQLLSRRSTAWLRTTGGYSTAERWTVRFEDGTRCFVKSGAAHLAEFLRAEYGLVYSRLHRPFIPRLVAWQDDGEAPILVLEDLSGAQWPPPWDNEKIARVREALDHVGRLDVPDAPAIDSDYLRSGWQTVADDPAPFLSLELTTPAWLSTALPRLIDAVHCAPLEGDGTLHLDVRSDNLCFVDGRAVLVDWNHTCRGNPVLDLAFWLPSLHSEGGPRPETLLPDAPAWAAVVSGYFAMYAGQPPIPQAPMVRTVQLSQLRAALPWAVSALDLPPLDGLNAPQAPSL